MAKAAALALRVLAEHAGNDEALTSGVVEAYPDSEPSRAEVDALQGLTLLEFGSPTCGYCRRTQPMLREALQAHPGVRHVKVTDASGRRLGRSFRVKLWPTLVFLDNGKEVARLVRPAAAAEIASTLERID